MRYVVASARIILGLLFVLSGLNGFLGFVEEPPLPPDADALITAFDESGYMVPLIKVTELVTGLLLLCNRFVPVALIALLPVTVNILLFHAFLDPSMPGVVIVTVLFSLNVFLIWQHRDSFALLRLPKPPLASAIRPGSPSA